MSISKWLYFKRNALLTKFRAVRNFYFFGRMDVMLGKHVIIKQGAGQHSFGKNFIVFDNCIFEVYDNDARIITGENCFLSYGVIVNCTKKIEMGNHVWVGEYSSIRDATHKYDKDVMIGFGGDIMEPITIGNNVWIGRGCLVLPGTVIEDNVVVAANSVVKGILKKNSMYGGSPAKFIKEIL